MKKKFEVIDHTADIGIIAYGSDYNELFVNAAMGVVSLMVDADSVEINAHKSIQLEETDIISLLVKWLNEIIYEFEVERILYKDFSVVLKGDSAMQATCYGERYDPKKHILLREIKAATYHDLRIEKFNNLYMARVIFDI